ncbi:Rab3 GTPase-activating protein catalytic subunit isoform X1 [Tanacetum coccineum]
MYCWSTILVATDVAGRGIDIPDVAQMTIDVLQFQLEVCLRFRFWILYWAKQDDPVVLLTYKTFPSDDDVEVLNSESEIAESGQDDGCPWSEYYTAEDPLKGNIL